METAALVSQALVALTIEVDDEMERRMPHFTSKYGSITPGFGSPWLISVPLWFSVLRFIGPGMITVDELARRSGLSAERVSSSINGLVRWGYVVHHADPNDSRPKPPTSDWVVLPTTNGKRWHETFPVVIAEIEQAWRERHGDDVIEQLRAALAAVAPAGPSTSLPYLPILSADHRTPVVEPEPLEVDPPFLVTLLAQALLSLTYAVEPDLPVGLSLGANVVRVAAGDGVLVRDVPRRSGVAKQEATTMLNHLVRNDLGVVEPDPAAKGAKRLRLTHSGAAALEAHVRAVSSWDPPGVRAALERIEIDAAAVHAGGGWRSKVKAPDTLPHFPVVTGHGGYPDGS